VLYEMLAGQPPFTGATAQAIVAKVMTADAPSLSGQRRTVPPGVDRAVHRALERVPADRYASAADFAAALLERSDDSPHARERGGTPSRRPAAIGLLVAAAVAVLAGAAWLLMRGEAQVKGDAVGQGPRVVAVLPFRNISRDTAQQYFSAGMTEEITTQLGRVAALRVLGRSATAQYDSAGDRLERMARELGVGSVVDGSVRLAGDRVRIVVGLTDARTGQSLWSEQYDRQMADLFAVQDDVAHKVAEALRATLSPAEDRRVGRAPTSDMAAYQLYLRALDLRPTRKTERDTRAELLRQAIQLDSSFAAAYAHLARAYMFRSVAGEPAYADSGFAAARKAIALDPELADGHFALGDLLGNRLRFADARRSYLKALELEPSHDGAMADLANAYVALGRYDEALDYALRATQLDPNQPHGPYHVGLPLLALDDDSASARYLHGAERRFPAELRIQGLLAALDLRRGAGAAALERARKLVADNPDDTEGGPILAETAVVLGAPDAESLIAPLATRDPEAPAQMFPESLRSLYALTLHRRGDAKRATELWRQSAAAARRNLEAGAEGPAAPLELAAIAAVEARSAEAMDWLERSYRAGWNDARVLELDPFFDPVRQEPRYRAALGSMREETAAMRKRAAAAHPEVFSAVAR
jgi:TolB-like protein/Tfp pilus assembly protein PilF